ncbi:unnamed protein product [Adineta steineri]|uniref:Protein RFT1 homolog n=1 Tax=Adineta steineri TaxID=433720 RepID=A0A814PPA7_9BILA|nr:unnamed protein product [Adineta steineri]
MSFISSIIQNETIKNLISKILFYLINLIFNGLILRSINLNIIGLANIHLELIYTTILFLTRESLRHNVPKLNNIHSVYHYINLIWFIISIGITFISFILILTLFIRMNSSNILLIPYYNQTCFMYACAAFIELLSEPFYLLITVTRNYSINIYIQFIASIIGFGLQTYLIINNPECSLYYYGIGYIIYSLIITLSYYIYFLKHKKEKRRELFIISSFSDLLLKPTSPFVDHKLVNNTLKFFKQGISIKILTEGEKYLMIFFNLISYEQQGIYHIIYLLTNIFPRLIFSTIEQISLNYFQQTFSRTKLNENINQNNYFIPDDQMLLKRRKDDQTISRNNYQPPTPNGMTHLISSFSIEKYYSRLQT